jgi:hypothetical protein
MPCNKVNKQQKYFSMRIEMKTTNKFLFPPGFYYIGDLCYVMDKEWDEVCDITIDGLGVIDGVFNLADGRKFGLWGTAYGDGSYNDNLGREYPVDAGLIGIIAVEDIDESEKENLKLGNITHFKNPFVVKCSEGKFNFGNLILIDTTYSDMDSNYDEDCDEYYE